MNSIPLQQSKDVMTYPPHIDSAHIYIAESHQSQNSHVLGQIIILQNNNKKKAVKYDVQRACI
jgi:hypothetical protein